ncbi:hypothetical protein RSAG8_00527, partial [Rhizoctonia solani AG-8 WAC10335]
FSAISLHRNGSLGDTEVCACYDIYALGTYS